MRVVTDEASTSRGVGERLERRGSGGRRRRSALAREPQFAVLLLMLDHIRQVAEEVLAVAAYQDVRKICGENIVGELFILLIQDPTYHKTRFLYTERGGREGAFPGLKTDTSKRRPMHVH